MATKLGNALVDGRLLERPRSFSGNSQEWNTFKFVYKGYVGVVAPPILSAVDRTDNAHWNLRGRSNFLSKLDVLAGRSLDRISSTTHDERG